MAQNRPGASPPQNRSRKNSSSGAWIKFLGLLFGLFVVFFYMGLRGRAGGNPSANPDTTGAQSAALDINPDRVHVRELPSDSAPTASPVESDSAPRSERRERRRRRHTEPTPPAVQGQGVLMPAKHEKDADKEAGDGTPKDEFTVFGAGAKTEKAAEKSEDKGNVKPSEPKSATPPPPPSYRVQAGAYQTEDNARRMADRLAASGYQPAVTTDKSEGSTTYRVQVGPFPHKKAAEDAVRNLGTDGVSARVVDEEDKGSEAKKNG